jgi:hypothetical protein
MASKFIVGHVGVCTRTTVRGTRASHDAIIYHAPACAYHTFARQVYRDRHSCIPRFHGSYSNTMTFTPGNDSASIFKDGKLRSGIYKILNIVGQTYVDIREHTNGLCGRPATALEGKGLVGSCFCPASIVPAIIIFSGKFSLRDLDTPYAGYGVRSHFFLSCAGRGTV